MQVLEEYLRLRWGDDFRCRPEAGAAMSDVLSGTLTISELVTGRKLPLLQSENGD